MPTADLQRHVAGVLADLAAEWGRVDLVGRTCEIPPREYERYRERYERYRVCGGASLWLRHDDARLLVETPDGWGDPGDERAPGEGYAECARRVASDHGYDVRLTGLAQAHVLRLTDGGRPPLTDLLVVYEAHVERRGSATDGRWFTTAPDDLLYDELAEAFE